MCVSLRPHTERPLIKAPSSQGPSLRPSPLLQLHLCSQGPLLPRTTSTGTRADHRDHNSPEPLLTGITTAQNLGPQGSSLSRTLEHRDQHCPEPRSTGTSTTDHRDQHCPEPRSTGTSMRRCVGLLLACLWASAAAGDGEDCNICIRLKPLETHTQPSEKEAEARLRTRGRVLRRTLWGLEQSTPEDQGQGPQAYSVCCQQRAVQLSVIDRWT
uniref:Uncharacterized protein n=1 Tax=Knipowitschia caucasica TaxID=637954 RepID=A0AAV2M2I2_KNICA